MLQVYIPFLFNERRGGRREGVGERVEIQTKFGIFRYIDKLNSSVSYFIIYFNGSKLYAWHYENKNLQN